MTNIDIEKTNYYWNILKDVSDEIKLRLIVMLGNSIKLTSNVEEESLKQDETLMTKQEFFDMLDKSEQQYEQGKYVSFSSPEQMYKYFGL